MKKVEKTGFLKQAPNLFTSFCVILKNGGERRAHRKFESRERCIVSHLRFKTIAITYRQQRHL